jgi:hypothetical protein
MIDSFGFEVMSLDNLIEALNDIKVRFPQLSNSPVWLANCPPLFFPVKNVTVEIQGGSPGTMIYVERGGN